MERTRNEAVMFIKKQFASPDEQDPRKFKCWHYGRWELRDLLDFLYGERKQDDLPLD